MKRPLAALLVAGSLLGALLDEDAAAAGSTKVLVPPPPAMVRLPRATIQLGSSRDEVLDAAAHCNRDAKTTACGPETFANELGGPRVEVPAFWIDRREVSFGEYQHCVRQGRCRPLPYARGAERLARSELPAVFVTWDDARRYCAFRGARLPTEPEFERAARGTQGRRYPWGELFHGALANHGRWGVSRTERRDGFDELAPTTSFEAGATPEGILQLAGNVAEWTSTPYAPYDETDPPGTNVDRVVRGGHYLAPPAWLRGAARLHEPPSTRAAYLGFRCARSDP